MVRRGSAKTERRPSAISIQLDTEADPGRVSRPYCTLPDGIRSRSRLNFLLAAEWLLSRRNADYLFSFPSVCARLELDGKYIATQTLRRLDERRVELIREHFERAGSEWLAEPPDEPMELPEAA